jgi:hypothetical protein
MSKFCETMYIQNFTLGSYWISLRPFGTSKLYFFFFFIFTLSHRRVYTLMANLF